MDLAVQFPHQDCGPPDHHNSCVVISRPMNAVKWVIWMKGQDLATIPGTGSWAQRHPLLKYSLRSAHLGS